MNDDRQNLPSASAFRRYELCHGSFQLEQEAWRLGQAAHEASVAAERGTRIHAYLAGQPDEDGKEIVLTDTEETTADFLQERATDQINRIFGDQAVQQLNEKRLWLTVNGKRALSGQFDRCIYTPTVALCIDFKTGFSQPDPAEQNSQMKVLAVLVALHMPDTLQEVIVQIVSGPFGVTEYRYDLPALARAYEEILVTLKAIGDPMAALTPSVESCRYCPAKLICPALQDKRVGIARMELTTLPDGPQASMILDDVAVIRSRCDEIVAYYEAKLLADPSYEIPGYAMLPGPQRREVANWKAARARLEEFVGAEELEQLANYSIPSVEKLIAKALKLKAKEAGLKLAEILGDLLTVRQGNLCLKRVNNSKPKLVSIELP